MTGGPSDNGDGGKQKATDAVSRMGWKLEDIKDDDTIHVPTVKVMTKVEAERKMAEIRTHAASQVNGRFHYTTGDKQAFEVAVVTYGIINSASHQHDFDQEISGPFGSFSATAIREAVGTDMRRFYRAWAQEAYLIMQARPLFAAERAKILRLPTKHKNYAFDFADGMVGVPEKVLIALEVMRNWRTRGSSLRPRMVPKSSDHGGDDDQDNDEISWNLNPS